MVGTPKSFNTKKDYENAVDYACATNSGKGELIAALKDLKNNTTMLVLKKSSESVPVEEQTTDDYEEVENPACKKIRLGFSDAEIDALLAKIE